MRPKITCSLTVSRVPAHWLRKVRWPYPHLESACDCEGAVIVLPKASTRRYYQPHLLMCQECQRLLDETYGDRSSSDLPDNPGGQTTSPDPAG